MAETLNSPNCESYNNKCEGKKQDSGQNVADRSDLRSQTLDLLRFPLALVVLIVHVFASGGITFQGHTTTFESYPIFTGLNRFIDAFLRGQSVPIYYFISGYVFFLGIKITKDAYLRKFKNRVKSLLIPYLVWNAIAVVILAVQLNSVFNRYATSGVSFNPSLSNFLSCFWVYDGGLSGAQLSNFTSPLNEPLWFVRNLMIVVLCTPLIHLIIRKTKVYCIMVLGTLWLIVPFIQLETYKIIDALVFFMWGAYMSINHKDMLNIFGKYFKSSVVLYVLLGLAYILAVHLDYKSIAIVIKHLNILVGLLFAYNISSFLIRNGYCKVNKFLSSASFFIYVSHALICRKILKLMFVFFNPTSDMSVLLVYTMATLLTVGSLLGVFYAMRRYTPYLLKVVAGRK